MSAPCPALGFRLRLLDADAATMRAVARALHELLDAQGLAAVVAPGGEWIVRREGSQTTEADRELVERWLSARGDVRASVGPVVDLGDD